MNHTSKSGTGKGGLHLNKWFLDFVSDEGEAMIFYAAILKWRGWKVPYTSWLHYDPAAGVSQRSRYRNTRLPEIKDNSVHWYDKNFKVSGHWEAMASPLQARLYDSDEGYLDWNCFQPASSVSLKINDKELNGTGYVEQLILTADPWKIPMKELRWGRYASREDHMVWIELKDEGKQQWMWYNGKKTESPNIGDDIITIPSEGISLEMDRAVVLESEQKILQVVRKLAPYLPGFDRTVPYRFLMADEFKWLSRGILQKKGEKLRSGWTIHELVNFNPLPE